MITPSQSFAIAAFASLISIASALSQNPSLPPLEAIRVPKNAAWTTEFNYPVKALEKTTTGRVKTLRVQKQGDVYSEVRTYEDGRTEARLVLSGIQFEIPAPGAEPSRLLPSDNSASDYSESDFPELAWANGLRPRLLEDKGILVVEVSSSEKALSKKQKKERAEIESFFRSFSKLLENKGTPPIPEPPSHPPVTDPHAILRLYLDPQTKLPVRFESQEFTSTYSFEFNAPALQLPEIFKGAYENWRNEMTAASRPPSKP